MTARPKDTLNPPAEQREQVANARPFASPIAALKDEIDRALNAGDGHLAELAHDLLTEAEWAQRCLETVRRCTR